MKRRSLGTLWCSQHIDSLSWLPPENYKRISANFQFFGHNVPKYRSENFASRERILALFNTYDMSHYTCMYDKRFPSNWLKTENLWRPLEGAWPDTGVNEKVSMRIIWYRAMLVPNYRIVAFIVTEEMSGRTKFSGCKKNNKNKNKDSTVSINIIKIPIKSESLIRIVPKV